MVGATMPRNLEETFTQFIEPESLQWIRTENLHKIMPHVTQIFLRMDGDKKAGLCTFKLIMKYKSLPYQITSASIRFGTDYRVYD